MDNVKATIRTNNFTLEMSGLSDLKFEINSHSITDGQPWEGISKIECNDKGCTMSVMAGRKDSNSTANWFADAIKPGSAVGCDTIDNMPDQLNFAFKGTMSFDHGGNTYTGNDVVIAQGSTDDFQNNWWIGGAKMSVVAAAYPFAAAAAQTFKVSTIVPIAKVTFSITIGHISSMQMGIVGLQE